jgi:hypothetical protein
MKITKSLFHAGVLGLSLLATSVMAAVPAAEADKLGKSLTPMGAEMAGNADGSIPAWKPLPKNAGTVDSQGFPVQPVSPANKPLFTITAQNADQYKDKLAPGQYAMFKRYPETFKMPVYPSHRGATVPDDVFAAIKAQRHQHQPGVRRQRPGKLRKQPCRSRFRKAASKSSGTTSPAIAAAA